MTIDYSVRLTDGQVYGWTDTKKIKFREPRRGPKKLYIHCF